MNQKGKQFIGCLVASCRYNEKAACTLEEIQVSPRKDVDNGNPHDETLCASYRKKVY